MNAKPSILSITVVIPHLNQQGGLLRCLAALDAGTRVPDQVIVVDNGSELPPDDICAAYEGVILLHEATPGPGPARNLGVAGSTGDILAFIDADCIPAPDWIATAEKAMGKSGIDILGGDVRIEYDDPGRLTVLEAYESIFAYRMDRYIAEQGFTGTGNLVVRRDVFEKVGPFAGVAVAEDRDWGLRATGLDFSIQYLAEMRVFHPARQSFAELQAKWNRQISHDMQGCVTWWDHLRWLGKALALVISPLAEIPRIVTCCRVTGLRNRTLAFVGLTRIRMFRAVRMVQLFAGMDADHLVRRWNRSDAR